jgi:signal transduction histidine kinase
VLADELGIIFEITEKAKKLPNLHTNPDRILQVLNILINSAMKFVNENGIIIVDAVINKRNVTILVKDNGIGIEKDVLPYVFDRFYKEDRARNTDGSGLGLSIAKEIIEGLY